MNPKTTLVLAVVFCVAAAVATGTLDRVTNDRAAAPAVTSSASGTATLFAGRGGHFEAPALVDGTHIDFVVDTGASVVSLSQTDARRLGIDLEALDYRVSVQTANGLTFAAPYRLSSITIGQVELYDVQAIVHRGPALPVSLLGMSFLSRLSSFEIDRNRLVLRQ